MVFNINPYARFLLILGVWVSKGLKGGFGAVVAQFSNPQTPNFPTAKFSLDEEIANQWNTWTTLSDVLGALLNVVCF